jgi:hypothetical protein
MGSGSYTGSHTKIFISNLGTRWEVPDLPAKQPDHSRRHRWDEEVVGESEQKLRRVRKEVRSFFSMCAVAFRDDVWTDSNPKPPPVLQKEVRLAGGSKNWIAASRVRLKLFEDFFRKATESIKAK